MKCYDLSRHRDKPTCIKLQTRRRNERMQDKQFEAENIVFTANNKVIERVHSFKYLGRWISDNDDDTKCIQENLNKARQRWNSIANILKREGANAVCMGRFYQVIVQAVLLHGADSWSVSNRNMRKLQSFHRRVVRYITGNHIRKVGERWEYPNHDELFQKAKLLPIEKYLERRRGTLRAYLEKEKPELLREAERTATHCYNPNKILWWTQPCTEKLDFNVLHRCLGMRT